MTDVRTFSMEIDGSVAGTSFGINCNSTEEAFFFDTPLYLGAGAPGDILVRLDDQPAEEWKAFLSERTALLSAPLHFSNPRDNLDLVMMQMAAASFRATLQLAEYQRLRARLRTPDSRQIDLEFDISGLRAALHKLEELCRPERPRAHS